MDSPWIRFRLAATSALLYAAYRVAPRATRPIIHAMVEGFDTFPEQLRMGRNWGVIQAAWAIRPEVLTHADELHEAGARAMARKRLEIERRVRENCN